MRAIGWPPSIMRLAIPLKSGRHIRLWLPIFLFWPLIIAVCLLTSCFAVIYVFLRGRPPREILRASTIGWRLWALFASLRGLRLGVQESTTSVNISIW